MPNALNSAYLKSECTNKVHTCCVQTSFTILMTKKGEVCQDVALKGMKEDTVSDLRWEMTERRGVGWLM